MRGTIHSSGSLIIRDTKTVKGRGVFAARNFLKGETVETSPVIVLHDDLETIPESLQSVLYDWGWLCGREGDMEYALALGTGSLFNHSAEPALSFEADDKKLSLFFKATRNILEGEELTINYGEGDTENEGWFSSRGMQEMG